MKQAVQEKVTLTYPDFEKCFDIHTDASDLQLGGVLSQETKPLGFWSRKCKPVQQHYPVNKKELLSVRDILREYRGILWGQRLRVFTDHKNLTFARFENMQSLRWRLEIEEYGAELLYIKGEENIPADALSRLPTTTSASAVDATLLTEDGKEKETLYPLDLESLAMAQARELTEEQQYSHMEVSGQNLWVLTNTTRIVVPKSLQQPMLQSIHEWLMHPGEDAIYLTMKTSLYWSGMQKDVIAYVKGCGECALCKRGGPRYDKLPLKTIIARPWVEISIDSLGPFQGTFRVLTIIDTSTRLVTVVATYKGTSLETAQVVDRRWFNVYPRPQRCIYDQGPEFGRVFQELLASYGVKSKPTTVKNPQANAIVERVHGTINNKLRTCDFESTDEWENYLSSVTFSLRATYHSMIGCSPAQAAFHRDMFFDMVHHTDWNEQYQRKLAQAKAANVRENLHRVPHQYAPGDQVLLSLYKPTQAKMDPAWEGPFRVAAVYDNGTIAIDRGRQVETLSIRRVKPAPTKLGDSVVGG